MFGADTPLMMDAFQMAALAPATGAGVGFLMVRRRRKDATSPPARQQRDRTPLEERVRVLERIATDRSHDLAEEIEALRISKPKTGEKA